MEGESGANRSIIDELHCWDIQRDEVVGESGVTRSIMDEVYFWVMQEDEMEVESMVLLEVSSMNFILAIFK